MATDNQSDIRTDENQANTEQVENLTEEQKARCWSIMRRSLRMMQQDNITVNFANAVINLMDISETIERAATIAARRHASRGLDGSV